MKTRIIILFLLILFGVLVETCGLRLEAASHEARLGSSPTSNSAYVIDAADALWAWGENRSGQLGVGFESASERTPMTAPVPAGEAGWLTVAGGGFHALGISDEGRLYAWGNNAWGQLGVGITNSGQPTAGLVEAPSGAGHWTAVAAGYWHSLGLAANGQLYTWGQGRYGELGYSGEGTYYFSARPSIVGRPANVNRWTAIFAGQGFSLGIGDDGALYAWGYNSFGQLGIGRPENQTLPVKVLAPDTVKKWMAVAAGVTHTVALGDDGGLYAWGSNMNGQLGNEWVPPTGTNSPVPVPSPPGVTYWTAVAAGAYHTLTMAGDGQLFSCGGNYSGQLGDGTFTNRCTLGPVVLPAGVTRWLSFTCGREYSLAIGDDCRMYAWGSLLIAGTTTSVTVPTPVPGVGDLCPSSLRLSDAGFHLSFPGISGSRLRIEGSTDLKNWTPLCTNLVTEGTVHFVDPVATDRPRRFYRALPDADAQSSD
jgi:alpha-tubulin suppressor-like RCC1 family protein